MKIRFESCAKQRTQSQKVRWPCKIMPIEKARLAICPGRRRRSEERQKKYNTVPIVCAQYLYDPTKPQTLTTNTVIGVSYECSEFDASDVIRFYQRINVIIRKSNHTHDDRKQNT